ncbi:MAG: winged helix-turn-helix domain-containing protein [Candidatus Thermoplasmatota archaeon]|jgi:DNA-binding transcriptional ArsR family regulator
MRERLLALVHEQPGINKSALCGRLGIAWGTVSYHVTILADAGLVDVEAEGRETNLFPRGLAEGRRRLLRVLREPMAQQVLGALGLVREGGLHELSAQLGQSRKIVRRHLSQLLAAGLVQDKGTRRPRYALAASPRLGPVGPMPLLAFAPDQALGVQE